MIASDEANTAGPFACDGADTTFDFTFGLSDDDDLEVWLVTAATGAATKLTKTTDYTITSANTNDPQDLTTGGTVTTVATYSSSYKILLRRNTVRSQPTNLDDEDVEDCFDRITRILQDLRGVLPWLSVHDYAAGTTTWSISETEAQGTGFSVTNAGGAVAMAFPAAQPGKVFSVYNGSGYALTVQVTGETGQTATNAKYSVWTMSATDCVKISEQA